MDARLQKLIQRLNVLAATIESPLAAIFKTCGIGDVIENKLLPHLPSSFTRSGARLVIVGAVGIFLTIIGALLGFLQLTVRIVSLCLASRNSVVAIESGSSHTKPLLVYFVLMIGFMEIDRLPFCVTVLNSIPFYGIAHRLFLLTCSVPESGVAMLVYETLLRPFCLEDQHKTLDKPDSVKQKQLSLIIKSVTALPAGEIYFSVRVFFLNHESTDELTYLTPVSRSGQWHEAVLIPLPEPHLTHGAVKIELLSKEVIGSDKVLATTKFDLGIDNADSRQLIELSLVSPSGDNFGALTVNVSL